GAQHEQGAPDQARAVTGRPCSGKRPAVVSVWAGRQSLPVRVVSLRTCRDCAVTDRESSFDSHCGPGMSDFYVDLDVLPGLGDQLRRDGEYALAGRSYVQDRTALHG